jgi:hypothetical protein
MEKYRKIAAIVAPLLLPQGTGISANLYTPEQMCEERISQTRAETQNNIRKMEASNGNLHTKASQGISASLGQQHKNLESIMNCIKSLRR